MTEQSPAVDALFQQALAFQRQGDLAQAEQLYRQVLAQAPDHFDALQLLGIIAHEAGRPAQAEELTMRSLSINPNQPAAWNNLGSVLMDLKRYDAALAAFGNALHLRPNYPSALNNRATALLALRRPDEALMACDEALTLQPDNAQAYANRATAFLSLQRPVEALQSCEHALRLRPENADTIATRATALMKLNHIEEALAEYRHALDLNPDSPEAHLGEGFCQLIMGNLAEGWQKYEWRWRNALLMSKPRSFPRESWSGAQNIAGKTLLLYAEQGFGDTIQFFRYVPLVLARGARVVLVVQEPLKRLLRASTPPGVQVLAEGEALPEFDYHCALMSLPLAFNTTVATIPATVPYVTPPAEALARWRNILGEKTKPRIGIVWAGNPKNVNDLARSIPPDRLDPLLACGRTIISLQRDLQPRDRQWLNAHPEVGQYVEHMHEFTDTASLVHHMDLVISVDTSTGHVAGAMAKPAWIFLPFMGADWRWMREPERSPWYPHTRLFRQQTMGDWDSVIARVVEALRGALST